VARQRESLGDRQRLRWSPGDPDVDRAPDRSSPGQRPGTLAEEVLDMRGTASASDMDSFPHDDVSQHSSFRSEHGNDAHAQSTRFPFLSFPVLNSSHKLDPPSQRVRFRRHVFFHCRDCTSRYLRCVPLY
jgi:hypothetical protein